MKKLFALALAVVAVAVQAESAVGSGTPNMALDSTPCFSWSGGGAAWTRCPAQAPQIVEKQVIVEKPVIVEKIVEKPVIIERLVPSDKKIGQ